MTFAFLLLGLVTVYVDSLPVTTSFMENSTVSIVSFSEPLHCPSHGECPAGFFCETSSELCLCDDQNEIPVYHGEYLCVQMKSLGQECSYTEQCKISNSICSDGNCACDVGFFTFSDVNVTTCEKGGNVQKHTEEEPEEEDEGRKRKGGIDKNHMIPIMVVLGIMFIGMCVALNLFSRARFRDQRSVFSNPNPRLMHIKLSTKRKKRGRRGSQASGQNTGGSRQASICSQLSPHQSFSGSSRRSSQDYLRGSPNRQTLGENVYSIEGSTKGGPSRVRNGPASTSNGGSNSPTIIVNNPPAGGRL